MTHYALFCLLNNKFSCSIQHKPLGIASNLINCPPVFLPAATHFAIGTPKLLLNGANTNRVVSPTPPVEAYQPLHQNSR